jgi:hypothetical protein
MSQSRVHPRDAKRWWKSVKKGSPSSRVEPPETVRLLQTPGALELADLTAIFEDLTKVVECCEQILTASGEDNSAGKEVLVESLWITAVVSYRRCFCVGRTDVALREQDLNEISLQGDVVQWHNTLGKICAHYVDGPNPRDAFVAGAAQDSDGNAIGIAVTSTPRPQPDATTVRQTGQLALELSQLVVQRIEAQQELIYKTLRSTSPEELASLPVMHIATPRDAEIAPNEPSIREDLNQA